MDTDIASEENRSGYSVSAGIRLLRSLSAQGKRIFTSEDAKLLAASTNISMDYIGQVLPRLVEGGWAIRIKRGLYAVTGGLPGGEAIPSFAIATSLVMPSAISLWSAMSFHGLTEQVPRIISAITPKKVVTPSMRGGAADAGAGRHVWKTLGQSFEYVTVKPQLFFGIDRVWIEQDFRVPITDRERTMLEGFASPALFGGLGEVLGIFEEHLTEMDLQKLVGYALKYGKAAVGKRLGWAMERMGVAEKIFAPLQELPIKGFRLLDPVSPAGGPYVKRWGLRDNLLERAA